MTVALQVPLSVGFPRQEYWSRLPFPSQEILANPGMEPVSPALQVDSLPVCCLGSPQYRVYGQKKDTQKPNYSPWNFLGQNTRVGSLFLLQRIFPTQGSNPGLLHCRWILYQLSHKGCQENHKEKCSAHIN